MCYLNGLGDRNVQRLRAQFSWQLGPCLEVGLRGTKFGKNTSRTLACTIKAEVVLPNNFLGNTKWKIERKEVRIAHRKPNAHDR